MCLSVHGEETEFCCMIENKIFREGSWGSWSSNGKCLSFWPCVGLKMSLKDFSWINVLLGIGFRKDFFPGRVVRRWEGLPRESWSLHPWRCLSNNWVWTQFLSWWQDGNWSEVGLSGLGALCQPQRFWDSVQFLFLLLESILPFHICGLLLIYRNVKYFKYCACEAGVLILLFCFCCLLLIMSVAVQTRWEDYSRKFWLCFVFLHCQAGQQAVCSTESFPPMCTWKYCKSNVKNRIIETFFNLPQHESSSFETASFKLSKQLS